MINVQNVSVMNFDNAMRGLRNPMNSWDKSDSFSCHLGCYIRNLEFNCDFYPEWFVVGQKDIELCQKMLNAGDSDSKFMRQIFVSMDITAPAYFCAEFDTYKVGTTRNSCSFMHKGTAKEFERSDFSTEDMDETSLKSLDNTIHRLNELRQVYLDSKNAEIFLTIRKLLPQSYNYRFTWTGSYANLRNMYFQRKNHRLPEWREFCQILECFPYGKELICYKKEKSE